MFTCPPIFTLISFVYYCFLQLLSRGFLLLLILHQLSGLVFQSASVFDFRFNACNVFVVKHLELVCSLSSMDIFAVCVLILADHETYDNSF